MPIRKFEKDDIQPLSEIIRSTDVFRPEEVDVAIELMQIAADNPGQRDYILHTYVDDEQKVLGYYCVGPTPMTASTFDLYWIVVHPEQHGKGLGHQLLEHCEEVVRSMDGLLIMVETSSLTKYEATRKFYLRNKYDETARVKDYYSQGDDLIVYSKHL